ncbi:MAG: ATP-binding protein [Methylococcaceae bacterium]
MAILLCFVLGLGADKIVVHQFKSYEESKEKQKAFDLGDHLRSTLELKINAALNLEGLNAYLIATHGILRPIELEALLSASYKQSQYIRNIGVSPDNHLQYIFPVAGNEAAIGLHFAEVPAQWPMIQRAIRERKPNLAGPLQLVEGVSGLIYWVPVFMPDGSYWGLISTVINTDDFLGFIKPLLAKTGMEVALRGLNGQGEQGAVFWGDPALFDNKRTLHNIQLPGGSWQLVVKPSIINVDSLWLWRLVSTLLIILLSVLVFITLFAWNRSRLLSLRLVKITSNIPGMVFQCQLRIDGSTYFPYVSEGIRDIFELNPMDIRNNAAKALALVHPDDVDGLWFTLQQSASDLIPWHHEFRVKLDVNKVRWLLGSATTERKADGSTLWHGLITDITERKQLDEQLRISESTKKAVLESSLDAIMSIDQQGNICRFNQSALAMFDYTMSEVMGKPMVDLLIPERHHESYKRGFQSFLTTGKSAMFGKRFELVARHRWTGEFPIEIFICAFESDNKKYFTATLRDITKAKLAETSLREGREQAEQANQVKSQFLATMSHEIRTPLNALLGTQELLAKTTLDDTQKNYVKLAIDSGNNLLTLVNDILDLTKVEAGKLDMENTVFNVIELVNDLVLQQAVKSQEKNLAVSIIVAPDVSLWISGDPWRFRQVLLNLVDNAIKFTPSGSITVKLSSRLEENGDGVLLVEVLDTGIGIAEKIQPQLFEVFTQADPSDTRKYGGSGLGLAISKRLVELWGGHLGMESHLGVGSRFWFSCGSAACAPQAILTANELVEESPEQPAAVAQLLLVEDSIINQIVLENMLILGGHHVDIADCGTAGIAAAAAKQYDLIFMDVSMPDMTGMEATRSIRELGGGAATVPIIAITAHALKGYKEMCLAAGMNGYITKPITIDDLLATVQQWCGSAATKPASIKIVTPIDVSLTMLDEDVLRQLVDVYGMDKMPQLVNVFINELIKRCNAIKSAIEQRDLTVLCREAHTIKSGAAIFGAKPLQALAAEIEACNNQDNLAATLLLADRLLLCAEATLAALAQRHDATIAA